MKRMTWGALFLWFVVQLILQASSRPLFPPPNVTLFGIPNGCAINLFYLIKITPWIPLLCCCPLVQEKYFLDHGSGRGERLVAPRTGAE